MYTLITSWLVHYKSIVGVYRGQIINMFRWRFKSLQFLCNDKGKTWKHFINISCNMFSHLWLVKTTFHKSWTAVLISHLLPSYHCFCSLTIFYSIFNMCCVYSPASFTESTLILLFIRAVLKKILKKWTHIAGIAATEQINKMESSSFFQWNTPSPNKTTFVDSEEGCGDFFLSVSLLWMLTVSFLSFFVSLCPFGFFFVLYLRLLLCRLFCIFLSCLPPPAILPTLIFIVCPVHCCAIINLTINHWTFLTHCFILYLGLFIFIYVCMLSYISVPCFLCC